MPRSTVARDRFPGHQQPRPTPARALCNAERERVLDVLSSPRFVDRSPGEIIATLLDENEYVCSERTMYRILAANQAVRDRRNQREHPQYTKPELMATAPNQVWSWEITKLLGSKKWTYYYLYVLLDITEHRHGDICMLTPYDVHYGRAPEVLAQRQQIMNAAWAAHPERFVRGIPKIRPLPDAVWINPPATSTKGEIAP